MTDDTQEQQITAAGNEMSASFLAAKKRSDATLAKLEENPGKFACIWATTSDPFANAWPCRTAE